MWIISFSGVIMIVVNKGVATIILALFISNFLIFTAVYLLSKVVQIT